MKIFQKLATSIRGAARAPHAPKSEKPGLFSGRSVEQHRNKEYTILPPKTQNRSFAKKLGDFFSSIKQRLTPGYTSAKKRLEEYSMPPKDDNMKGHVSSLAQFAINESRPLELRQQAIDNAIACFDAPDTVEVLGVQIYTGEGIVENSALALLRKMKSELSEGRTITDLANQLMDGSEIYANIKAGLKPNDSVAEKSSKDPNLDFNKLKKDQREQVVRGLIDVTFDSARPVSERLEAAKFARDALQPMGTHKFDRPIQILDEAVELLSQLDSANLNIWEKAKTKAGMATLLQNLSAYLQKGFSEYIPADNIPQPLAQAAESDEAPEITLQDTEIPADNIPQSLAQAAESDEAPEITLQDTEIPALLENLQSNDINKRQQAVLGLLDQADNVELPTHLRMHARRAAMAVMKGPGILNISSKILELARSIDVKSTQGSTIGVSIKMEAEKTSPESRLKSNQELGLPPLPQASKAAASAEELKSEPKPPVSSEDDTWEDIKF